MAVRPVKLKLLPRTTVKVKSITVFPGLVIGGDGIEITKTNGIWTIAIDSPLSLTGATLSSPTITGTATITAAVTASGVWGFTQAPTVTSTTAGASAGPLLSLFRNITGAVDNLIGYIAHFGNNSTPAPREYARSQGRIKDPTAGSEDGEWSAWTAVAGTLAERVTIGQGMQIGAPAGGDPGSGGLNVAGSLLINNVAVAAGGRTKLTANLTINVTASATAIQTAIDTILQTLDPNKYIVTIQCANGTYSGGATPIAKLDASVPGSVPQFTTYPSADETSIIIKGNAADRTLVVLDSTAAATFIATNGACVAVQDCTITNTGSGAGLNASGGFIFYGNCILGATGGSKIIAQHGGVVEPYSDFALKDNSSAVYSMNTGGSIWMGNRTVTLLNSFTVTEFVKAESFGELTHLSSSYSGAFTVTGKKFTIDGGSINTGTTTITELPGTLPGTISTGWYGTRPLSTTKHEISANLLATASPLAGTMLHLTGPDAANVGISIDSYGAFQSFIQLRGASGTGAVPTALTNNQTCGAIAGAGYHSGGAFSGSQATMGFFAAEAWTNTARGSYVSIYNTPTGSTTIAEAWRLNADKTLRLFGYTTAGVLTNDTSGNIASNVTLPAARFPILTGDVTTSGGSLATTLAAGSAAVLNSGTLASARISGSYTGLTGTGTLTAGATGAGFTVDLGASTVTKAATAWTPTFLSQGGTLTTVTINMAKYFQIGKLVMCVFDITITDAGTGTTALKMTAPVTPTGTFAGAVSGRESNSTGKGFAGGIRGATSDFYITLVDNANPCVTGYQLVGHATYVAA